MEERLQFVMEAKDRAPRTFRDLCERYGIRTKTGYKWVKRYQEEGVSGLLERSRAPHHPARQVDQDTEKQIIQARWAEPKWGAKKLRIVLQRDDPDRDWPAVSTIAEILKREGLTNPRKPRRHTPGERGIGNLSDAVNQMWTADYKGWFKTRNGERFEPLTIMDSHSRFLLRCQAVHDESYEVARGLFEAAFREYGLPEIILTDNGAPFASTGLGGLTRLAVWWIKLGIHPLRTERGRPDQNGRHERMHGTLQWEAATPPAGTWREQQRQMEQFRNKYNHRRPHEALAMKTPASVYGPSARAYPSRLSEPEYTREFHVRRVGDRGEIRWQAHKVFISHSLQGEPLGLRPWGEHHWEIWFGTMLLGLYANARSRILTPQEAARLTAEKHLEEKPWN